MVHWILGLRNNLIYNPSLKIVLDVIGMATNQRYLINNQRLSLDIFAASVHGKKGILQSIHTTMANRIEVKVVFVPNRNKKANGWQSLVQTVRFLNKKLFEFTG
jgi:hypothetical protein